MAILHTGANSLVHLSVSDHFVSRSFRIILVISYPLISNFVPSNNNFVPRSFRTHFCHFVPSSPGYELTFQSEFVPKSLCTYFWSFRTLGGGLAQWLGPRITDQRVPGSSPGRGAVRCGLAEVTFTPCLVLVKPRKRWTYDRLGQTETMLCLIC